MAELGARHYRARRPLSGRLGSLTARILTLNLIVLVLMASSLFYLDSYRNQLVRERLGRARGEAEIAAVALARVRPDERGALIAGIGTSQHIRLRLFAPGGGLLADSFALAPPSFAFADPAHQPALQSAARLLDRGMDALLGKAAVADYRTGPAETTAAHWPEVASARAAGIAIAFERYAPDRTPVITAAAPVGGDGAMLLTLRNSPDITQSVRDARQTLGIVLGVALLATIALSLFLARTIVKPLRTLVRAAVRVRRGRDRAVVVPRLPDRRDEIGLLARAISDMTATLRQRIDAVESFAADVAHEIKNPLASLRSALESLDKVEDADLRRQLAAIAAHDVQRIDRLVTEIADASRVDAELSRTTFVAVDLLALAVALVGAREARGVNAGRVVRIDDRGSGDTVVAGDPARLERVFSNLLDNAVSFSPAGGVIAVDVSSSGGRVFAEFRDQGPGIAPEARERVFERFHSLRPDSEDFGSHSGLGLAIARTIVEAHDGTLTALDPVPGDEGSGRTGGARLVVAIPAYRGAEAEE